MHEPSGPNGAMKGHADHRGANGVNGFRREDESRPAAAQEQCVPAPVAICGMSMRLPGGISNSETFWELLVSGSDARGPVPESRYNSHGFGDGLGGAGALKSSMGYFVDQDLSALDTSFFSLSRDELEKADPQQRQFLEVTRECLESAGEMDYRGKPIGCYVGTFGEDWLYMGAKETQHTGGYVYTGHSDLMIANRVSYEYDFTGPSMVIKTGCSASLTGLHEACRALQSGDCTAAVVGGTSLIMGPTATANLTADGILSPEASCKTFDAAADGFARAEAITAVYIKLLDDAIRDGNPIRAVIRNTASNSDGKSSTLMAPSGRSHELMMRKAYADCGLNPADTPFVECHGTGTATGDPIEATAVGNVFAGRGIFIGSVKPNVGHSEGSSGLSSLIKAVLALEHGIIPPNIKFNIPNPKIPFQEKNMTVPTTPTAWPKDRPRRISVNSFGIGGANAHVIVDGFDKAASLNGTSENENAPSLLLLSANKQDSLQSLIESHRSYLAKHPRRLRDLAYTLAVRREHLPNRAFAVIGEDLKLSASSPAKTPAQALPLVFVFSGQGAQWARMGLSLMESRPEFLQDIRIMDNVLQSLTHPPEWSIEQELQQSSDTSLLGIAAVAQPICTAIQIALVNVYARAGVHPAAVIGHSSGEISAAYASGALTLRSAMITAYYRGYVTKLQTSHGGMAAVGLSRVETQSLLSDGVVIACENSPTSVTISGDASAVQESLANINKANPDTLGRTLQVDQAYHSRHMESVGNKYALLIKNELLKHELRPRAPQCVFFSTVTEEAMDKADQFEAEYWQSNLISPVLFSTTAQAVIQYFKSCTFLEIGPHSTMAGPLRQICAKADIQLAYISSMLRNEHCATTLLSAFGQLFQAGYALQFQQLIPSGQVLTDLPTYPWDHSGNYWYEARIASDWRFRKFPRHSLLGARVAEVTDLEPAWRNVLHLDSVPWLRDHRITKDIVLPFAAYCTMAGEAVRQVSGVEDGYILKNVTVYTAMVLADSKPKEIVTTLRPHKVNNSLNSDYWEFSISSYSGAAWIKNCEGMVKARQSEMPSFLQNSDSAPRIVQPKRFYDAAASTGIQFGPTFQNLSSIRCSTTVYLSKGTIDNTEMQQDKAFIFHPTALDACLQLTVVAMTRGVDRGNLVIPTRIQKLEVSASAAVMDAVARIDDELDSATVYCKDGDRTAVCLTGIQLTPLDDGAGATDPDPHAAARLEWRPLLELQDPKTLFEPPESLHHFVRLQEELTLLCIIDCAKRLEGLAPIQPFFQKYRQWLSTQIQRAEAGVYPVLGNVDAVLRLTSSERDEFIAKSFEQLSTHPRSAIIATATRRIWNNVEAIFTGEKDVLTLLTEDKVLTDIYTATSFGYSGFIQLLSHANPTLKILEVGGGTGGTTQTFLRDLIDSEGSAQYSLYTFTDVSAGFFLQAKERFSYAPNMNFKVFDISRDPLEQGFETESYDLILAPSVIHATASLHDTLCNLRPLLRKGGHMVVTELVAEVKTPSFIFGNVDGWWLGEADGRIDEPGADVPRWDRELRDAGFSGTDSVVYDAEEPYQLFAAFVTRPVFSHPERKVEKHVTVISHAPQMEPGTAIISTLTENGYSVSVQPLDGDIPAGHDIICLLDLESDFFYQISEKDFKAFQQFLVNHGSKRLLFLTRSAQIRCQDPKTALSIGLIRTVRSDLASPFSILEIDPQEPNLADIALRVFRRVQKAEDNGNLAPDLEYVCQGGVVKTGRYHPYALKEFAKKKSPVSRDVSQRLTIAKPGFPDTITWAETSAQDLNADEVELKISAVGLGYKDVIFATEVSSSWSPQSFGMEASGTVLRVGSSVNHLKAGDRVIAISAGGTAASKVIIPAHLAAKIPGKLDFKSAATMPLSFATALQALVSVGRLEEGQSVLIHCAASGVGHAAIQICKALGAEIYATAGSTMKVEYVNSILGVPLDHIFSSRSDKFETEIKAATGGRGVDIVLNSLSGELLHASWNCVAKFGTLVDLGAKDTYAHGKLDMNGFAGNRSYCSVDMVHMMRERPRTMARLLEKVLDGYRRGDFHALRCDDTVGAADIIDAIRRLQEGEVIGKLILEMPEDAQDLAASKVPESLHLDPTASYLLTGGLGGLGKFVARWMVERGAKSLVFLSRSAGASEEDKDFAAELESMGCAVAISRGRVDDVEGVREAVAKAPNPIKGVVHFAMVIRDGRVTEISHADWTAGVSPKVDGAWNLHNVLSQQDLDFFIMASSVVSFNHQPGQCNYIAANTFLEAFCQFRRSQGLAASVINITPMDGAGFVADNPGVRQALKASGTYFLREHHLLDFVEQAMLHSRPAPAAAVSSPLAPWHSEGQFIMGLRAETPLDDVASRIAWRRDRRMALYHNVGDAGETKEEASDFDELRALLERAADQPDLLAEAGAVKVLAEAIGKKVFGFLMRSDEDIALDMTLSQAGLDSLTAIELRRWWRQVFGLEITVLEILATGTLQQLGQAAADALVARAAGENGSEA